ADNADDFVRLSAERNCEKALAERVFAGEVEPRKFVADHDDFRIVANVPLGEVAPLPHRDAHGAEIVVIDVAYITVRALRASRFRPALDFEIEVSGLPG